MIQIIAVLCSLSAPDNCREQTVTNSRAGTVKARRRAKLSPQERAVAREQYKSIKQLPPEKKAEVRERWRSIRITEFERRQMAALREELDHDYEAVVGLEPSIMREVVASGELGALRRLRARMLAVLPERGNQRYRLDLDCHVDRQRA